MELISREEVLALYEREHSHLATNVYEFGEMLKDIPVVEDRKTGKWIWSEDEKYYDKPTGNATYKCSLCNHGDVHAKTQKVPYCWWCGSKMEGAEE